MPISEPLKPKSESAQIATPAPMADARDRLIVALDAPNAMAATELVKQLEDTCHWLKVGLELFVAAGPSFVETLVSSGHSVFLDLKFYDIPNTVAGAVRSAANLGARLLTVPAAGGPAMLEAARNALDGVANPPQLLAVTVLTSMDDAQLAASGVEQTPAKQAELLAKMGLKAGIRGFVCSPEEVAALRALTGPEGVFAVPGIRPAGSDHGDQKRLATPANALRNGATYLVVGRPITKAANPAQAAAAILQEMAEALL